MKRIILSLTLLSAAGLQAECACHSPETMLSCYPEFKQLFDQSNLTAHDVTMLETLINHRLAGRMVKIAPNFSDDGNAVWYYILSKVQKEDGFQSEKGALFAHKVLDALSFKK